MCKGNNGLNNKSVLSVKDQIRLVLVANDACQGILGSLDYAKPNGNRKFEYYREEGDTTVKTCTINLEKWTCSCKEFKKHKTFCTHLAHAYLLTTAWDTGGDCGDLEVGERLEPRETTCPINDEIFSKDYKPGNSAE